MSKHPETGMSTVRANWMLAFRAKYGERQVVTRPQLLEFYESHGGDTTETRGPQGLVLRFPSWLTNGKPNPYKVGDARGVYRLPWNELNAFLALDPNTGEPKTSSDPVEQVSEKNSDEPVDSGT